MLSRKQGWIAALVLIALPASSTLAANEGFTCRNTKAEVTCTGTDCAVNTDGFTPMSVSFSGSRLEVCAYSTCQSAKLDLRRTRGDTLILSAPVAGGGNGSAVVALDRRQKIATMLWGSYALPMSCAVE